MWQGRPRPCKSGRRKAGAALPHRARAPETRPGALETRARASTFQPFNSSTFQLPRTEKSDSSQVKSSSGNGIITVMKNGATTLALMAAMLCGIGVFGGLESRCNQPPPTTQNCCSERTTPTGSHGLITPTTEDGCAQNPPLQIDDVCGG